MISDLDLTFTNEEIHACAVAGRTAADLDPAVNYWDLRSAHEIMSGARGEDLRGRWHGGEGSRFVLAVRKKLRSIKEHLPIQPPMSDDVGIAEDIFETPAPPTPEEVSAAKSETMAEDVLGAAKLVIEWLCGIGDSTSAPEPTAAELGLRQLQTSLPWTIKYSRDFRANPQPHKDFAHGLLHVNKAVGRLAELIDNMDHDRETAAAPDLRERYGQYVADLVVCALRMANTFPGGTLDLHQATVDRIETKNGVKLGVDMLPCQRCGFTRCVCQCQGST